MSTPSGVDDIGENITVLYMCPPDGGTDLRYKRRAVVWTTYTCTYVAVVGLLDKKSIDRSNQQVPSQLPEFEGPIFNRC